MPFVAPGEAHDLPFLDLETLTLQAGPPPWRLCLVGTPGLRVLLLHWPTGYATVPHRHPAADEAFHVLRGRAAFTIGEAPEREVGPGSLMLALRGVGHRIRVVGDESLTLMSIVAPNEDRPDETIESEWT
jgi:quercetin dioxygenase-like cupin family protein